MANEKNLIPNSQRSPREVRENARKGGINSGKTRREQKTVRKILSELMDSDIKTVPQVAKLAAKLGIDGKKSIKDIFTLIATLNTLKTANLIDLERLGALLGEKDERENNGILGELAQYLKGGSSNVDK